MTANPEQSIKRLRERIEEVEDMDEDDAQALRRMSDRIRILGPSKYSDFAHEKYLMRAVKIAQEVGGLADALEDRDAAERIVAWINTEKANSPETNKDYRVTLRQFGKLVSGDDTDEIPESIEWVPGGYPSNYDPAPDPGDMLRWEEDVLPMIEACVNLRDRALVALAWDLGPRPYELFDLSPKQITDHKYGLQVTVDGKQGRRSPVLIPSVPYVNRWLEVHPGSGSDPLFCNLNGGGSISNNRVRDILKEKARKAGVDRPVTPSNFRKSSASHLASQGVSQAHLEDHHAGRVGAISPLATSPSSPRQTTARSRRPTGKTSKRTNPKPSRRTPVTDVIGKRPERRMPVSGVGQRSPSGQLTKTTSSTDAGWKPLAMSLTSRV